MDNCFYKLFSIRRSDNEFMQQFRSDLEKTALYILLNREKSWAYIGETDAFLTRLTQHIARKSFWTEALDLGRLTLQEPRDGGGSARTPHRRNGCV